MVFILRIGLVSFPQNWVVLRMAFWWLGLLYMSSTDSGASAVRTRNLWAPASPPTTGLWCPDAASGLLISQATWQELRFRNSVQHVNSPMLGPLQRQLGQGWGEHAGEGQRKPIPGRTHGHKDKTEDLGQLSVSAECPQKAAELLWTGQSLLWGAMSLDSGFAASALLVGAL